MQDIPPESDDGCIVLKGAIAGKPAVVIALEGKFQAGKRLLRRPVNQQVSIQ
jgi:malonate decarboxylase beta subunit